MNKQEHKRITADKMIELLQAACICPKCLVKPVVYWKPELSLSGVKCPLCGYTVETNGQNLMDAVKHWNNANANRVVDGEGADE